MTQLISFIGICAYYRRFIGNFLKLPNHFINLQRKEPSLYGMKNVRQYLQNSMRLTSTPVLAYPNTEDCFILGPDASDIVMGAVLSQVQDGQERVVAYGSNTFSKSERNYCVTRKELCSVVYFVKHFRHYLLGKKFLVRTDHGSLCWLMNFKNPDGQMARWIEIFAPFDFEIHTVQAKSMKMRMPYPEFHVSNVADMHRKRLSSL